MEFILETERFLLRELHENDAESFYQLNSNPNVLQFTGDNAFLSVDEARLFLQNYQEYKKYGFGRWAIISKENHEFLGWCGLKFHPDTQEVDLGFRIFEKFWNQKIATEAAKACINYGFQVLNIHQIVGRAMIANKASISVLENCGFVYSKEIELGGKPAVQYEITRK